MTRHKQIFFQQTNTGESSIFEASSENLNKNNNVAIFVYGNLNEGTLKLQGKPLKNNEESSPPFVDIANSEGSIINLFAGSLMTIELIDGIEYRLSFTGSGANFSTQVIYDE